MIKKLKLRLTLAIQTVLTLLIAGIILLINMFSVRSNEMQGSALLSIAAENNGVPFTAGLSQPPDKQESDEMRAARLYYARVNESGQTLQTGGADGTDAVPENLAQALKAALAQPDAMGRTGAYRYLKMPKDYGQLVVFLDTSAVRAIEQRLLLTSVLVGAVSLVALGALTLLLASLMVRPVDEAFKKQKRFIADASHELKTPLSVITLNVDLLRRDGLDNQYLSGIQAETARMTHLVRSLLNLARLDAARGHAPRRRFSLSKAVLSVALPLESTAFEAGKDYQLDIADGVSAMGDEESIKQLAVILIDNALKHSDEKGLVSVRVRRVGGRASLEVYNTGRGLTGDEIKHIFDRFYRVDPARSSDTGGYGLGLSIAQSITSEHGTRVNVESEAGKWARFSILL